MRFIEGLTKEQKRAAIEPRVHGPFTPLENGMIDCTFDHPGYGMVPFTAAADDPEEYGRFVYAVVLEKMNEL